MKRVLTTLAAAVLALTTLSACTGSDAVDQSSSVFEFHGGTKLGTVIAPSDRKQAGNFTGNLLDGGKTGLAAAKGKLLVVNFWATWCSPCRTETPQFDSVYRQIRSRGVDFLGIDTKDVKGKAQSFVKNFDITYPNIYDESGETALRLGNLPATALPFTVLIDRQGRVAAVYIVRLAAKDLTQALDTLLAER